MLKFLHLFLSSLLTRNCLPLYLTGFKWKYQEVNEWAVPRRKPLVSPSSEQAEHNDFKLYTYALTPFWRLRS